MLPTAKEIKNHIEELKKKKPLEDYCNMCGDCCHGKANIGKSTVSVMDLPCKFLCEVTPVHKSCSVYAERHDKAPWCADLDTMIEKGLAPSHCPYVENLKGYIPSESLFNPASPEIKKAVLASVLMSNLVPYSEASLSRFIHKYVDALKD